MPAPRSCQIGTAFDWITQLELAATCSGLGKGGGRVPSTFNGSNSATCAKLVACPTAAAGASRPGMSPTAAQGFTRYSAMIIFPGQPMV